MRMIKRNYSLLKELFISGLVLLATDPAMANLTTTGRNLARKTQDLGKIVVLLMLVVAGIMYAMGAQDAKEKANKVLIGAVMIFAANSIWSWIGSSVR